MVRCGKYEEVLPRVVGALGGASTCLWEVREGFAENIFLSRVPSEGNSEEEKRAALPKSHGIHDQFGSCQLPQAAGVQGRGKLREGSRARPRRALSSLMREAFQLYPEDCGSH